MSYYHDAIIVTAFDLSAIESAWQVAEKLRLDPGPIVVTYDGHYRTFFVPPKGEREGTEEHAAASSARYSFTNWLRMYPRYEDNSCKFQWVAVRYGSDHAREVGSAIVVGSSR